MCSVTSGPSYGPKMDFSQMQLASAGGADLAASTIPVPPMIQYSMGEGSVYPRNSKKKHPKTQPKSGEPSRTQYHWYLFEQPDFPDDVNGKVIKSTSNIAQDIPARYKSLEQNNYREARTTSTTTRKPSIGGYYTGQNSDSYPNISWPHYSYSPRQPANYYMNDYDSSGWTQEDTEIKEPLIERIFGTLGHLCIPLAGLILLPLLLFPLISLILFALPGIPIPIIISEMPETNNSTDPMMTMKPPSSPMMTMKPPSNSSSSMAPSSSTSQMEMSTFSSMTSTMTESTVMMTKTTNKQEEAMQNRTDGATTAKHFGYVNVKLLKPTKRPRPPVQHKSTAFSNDHILNQDGFPFLFLNETFEDMHYRRNGKY